MGDILNMSGQKMAVIGEDGKVRNISGAILGYVSQNSQVHNERGDMVGSFGTNGYVYKGGTRIGTIHNDGRVFDAENRCVGKVVGDHMESGGAALLLLVI